MALAGFAIIPSPPLEGGVEVEFKDGSDRRVAHLKRAGLDDTFDPLRPPNHSGPLPLLRLVEENRPAFERVISATYRREVARAGRPVSRVEVDGSDIAGSGEEFTAEVLKLDAESRSDIA
jgi:hypothetical protein